MWNSFYFNDSAIRKIFCQILKADPDIDVVQLKRAGYKEFCAGRDMQGLFLIALMSRTLTGYLEGNCKEIVAQRCSAKKSCYGKFQ